MDQNEFRPNPNVATILSDGFVIDLIAKSGRSIGQILWGDVEKDFKHGWRRGDYACTTVIIKQIGLLFYTGNSIYQLLNDPSYIKLPLQELPALRAGIDPNLILLKLKGGYTITIEKD